MLAVMVRKHTITAGRERTLLTRDTLGNTTVVCVTSDDEDNSDNEKSHQPHKQEDSVLKQQLCPKVPKVLLGKLPCDLSSSSLSKASALVTKGAGLLKVAEVQRSDTGDLHHKDCTSTVSSSKSNQQEQPLCPKTTKDESHPKVANTRLKRKLALGRQKPDAKKPQTKISNLLNGNVNLDQTADFKGGCTPYLRKQKVKSHAVGSEHQNKGQQKSEVDEAKTSRSPTGEEAKGRKAEDGSGEATKVCRSCQGEVKLCDYGEHVITCLHAKYRRRKQPGESSTHNAVPLAGCFLCQICQQDLGSMNAECRQDHINRCMDKKAGECSSDITSDEALAKELQQREENKLTEEKATEEKLTFCQICQKDLGHLNSIRRTQHVNRCMDKAESDAEAQRQHAEALTKAQNRVLDCPLCGQFLRTHTSRKTHLKKCAAKYEITPSVLMARVKEQEEEYKLQLQAGILPPDTKPQKRKKNGALTKPSAGTTNVNRNPNSKFDEETQLALAISTSLLEEKKNGPLEVALTTDSASQATQSTVDAPLRDAFSILMTPSQSAKHDRKGRKKRARTRPYCLVEQSEEETRHKLAEKMATVLVQQHADSISGTPRLNKSKFSEKNKENIQEMLQSTLWNAASLISDEDVTSCFYVSELMPPLEPSSVSVGSKIKRMTNIPGWKPVDPHDRSIVLTREDADIDSPANSTTLLATTQTALLLAELAADRSICTQRQTSLESSICQERHNKSPHSISLPRQKAEKSVCFKLPEDDEEEDEVIEEAVQDTLTHSGEDEVIPRQTEQDSSAYNMENGKQGFCLPTKQDSKEETQLKADFGAMVNQQQLSDISFEAQDGTVFAHKFVLAARCPPQIWQWLEGLTSVPVREHSSEAVMAVMRYLYAANTDVHPSLAGSVKALAERLELAGLASVCSEVLIQRDVEDDGLPSDGWESSQLRDQDLDDLLRKAWGSDDSDSDTSSQQDRGEEGNKNADNEEAEMQELYDFMSSQHQRNSQSEDDTQKNGASQGNCVAMETSILLNRSLSNTASPAEQLLKLSDQEILSRLTDGACSPSGQQLSQDLLAELQTSFGDSMCEDRGTVNSEGSECMNQEDGNSPYSNESEMDVESLDDMQDSQGNLSVIDTENDTTTMSKAKEPKARRRLSSVESDITGPRISSVCGRRVSASMYSEDEDMFGEVIDLSDGDIGDKGGSGDHGNHASPSTERPDHTSHSRGINSPVHTPQQSEDSLSRKYTNLAPSSKTTTPDLFGSQDCGEEQQSPHETSQGDLGGFYHDVDDVFCSPVLDEGEKFTNSPDKENRGDHIDLTLEEGNDVSQQVNESEVDRDSDNASPVFDSQSCLDKHTSLRHGRVDEQSSPIHHAINTKTATESTTKESFLEAKSPGKAKRKWSEHDRWTEGKDETGRSSASFPAEKKTRQDSSPTVDDLCASQQPPRATQSKFKFKKLANTHGNTRRESPKKVDVETARQLSDDEGKGSSSDEGIIDLTNEGRGSILDASPHTGRVSSGHPTLDSPNHSMHDNKSKKESSEEEGNLPDLDTASKQWQSKPQKSLEECEIRSVTSQSTVEVVDLQDNVWEGFEDAGGLDEDFIQPASPDSYGKTSQPKPTEGSAQICTQLSPTFKTPSDRLTRPRSSLSHTPLVYDPPTDMDTDVSMLLPGEDDNMMWERDQRQLTHEDKAAAVEKNPKKVSKAVPKKKRKKIPSIPSPFTPMPGYDNMDTPTLRKECKKFGLRALPKKKLRVVLKDIYQKTHQYETDSDVDTDLIPASAPKQAVLDTALSQPYVPSKPKTSGRGKGRGRGGGKASERSGRHGGKTAGRGRSEGAEEDDSTSDSESSESRDDVPEESMMEDPSSAKLSKTDKAAKKKVVWDYIKAHDDIHTKALLCEPLEFDEFHQKIKETGHNIGAAIVMDALDDMCIVFTVRNSGRNARPAGRRKQNQASQSAKPKGRPKKTTTSQQAQPDGDSDVSS